MMGSIPLFPTEVSDIASVIASVASVRQFKRKDFIASDMAAMKNDLLERYVSLVGSPGRRK